MPRTPGQPISDRTAPHIRAALEKIDRDSDPWFLANWKVSILGDARIYAGVPRIRESALTTVGIKTRDNKAVREALRGKLTCERRDAVAFRRYASMLVGERWLARERTQQIAERFAPQLAAE